MAEEPDEGGECGGITVFLSLGFIMKMIKRRFANKVSRTVFGYGSLPHAAAMSRKRVYLTRLSQIYYRAMSAVFADI